MSTYHQLAAKVKELSVFCLENRGKCFAQFDAAQLFRYIAFHLLNGTLFVERDENGKVQTVVFAWRDNAVDILLREAAKEPQFYWQMPNNNGNAILIGQVIGKRRWMPQIYRKVMAHWPESPGLRLFSYRQREGAPRLEEFNLDTLKRFTYGLTVNP